MIRVAAWLCLVLTPIGVSAQTGTAQRWVQVASNDQGPIFLDTRSVVRAGGRVAAWYRTDLTEPGDNGEDVWMDRREVDCNARTIRLLAFSELRLDGSEVTSNSNADGETQAVRPGSVAEAMFDYHCR